MLISLKEIAKYVKIPENLSKSELLDLIGSRLVEIEEVIDLAPKYQKSYIVKVVSAEKIPDTHLTLCKIDAGPAEAQLAEDGLIQVVCGAPNVHAGMFAVWLAPGAIVPETYGNENFRLGKRKLRGYESNGMLAALDELDLGDDHDGIVEINPNMAQPGDSFAEKFELDDTIIDVENKSLTHRPDCFGLIGFAREVAGILGIKFEEPTWPEIAQVKDLPLSVKIMDSALCPRYSCAVFDLPKYDKSKYLTYYGDVFLAKAGMRSIDPMVDLTNIIMLRTGQPLHAFDYDKLLAVGGSKTAKIIVRAAEPGEELQLLDGKVIKCIPEDILITSNNVPVALAGAMGGKNTEIDPSTRRVVLESATFSLYNLRKTQMAHGIFSEAITRFTKGQPAAMTLPVLAETVSELGQSANLLAVIDEWSGDQSKNVVKITTSAINQLLGTNYDLATIKKTLENVGFGVTVVSLGSEPDAGATLKIDVPTWRTDIHIAEDIIEEVGRLLGYDNIPLDLPEKTFRGTEKSPLWLLKSELRSLLSDRLGMNELLTYSFISKDLLRKVGQDPTESYEIVNSISPELQAFRQQITPSLIDKVRENLKSGHRDFTFYEMNQVTSRSAGLTEEGTPRMKTNLGIVSLSDFYNLKSKVLTALRRGLRIDFEYSAMYPGSPASKLYPYLEPLRSAVIMLGDEVIGAFGEVKLSVLGRFKLDGVISACELNLDSIVALPRKLAVTPKLSRFPFVERDLTLKVNRDAVYGRFYDTLDACLEARGLVFETRPGLIYEPGPDSPTKNISFHLKFSSPEKTLEQSEISDIINSITAAVVELGAEVV